MKFTLAHATGFGWTGLKAKAYNSREDFENASAAVFEVTGSHGKIKTTLSDRIYYVLQGSGEFEINGNKFSVTKTDVIIVPKNTSYNYRATNHTVLKMFLVHTPAFDETFEIKLESPK